MVQSAARAVYATRESKSLGVEPPKDFKSNPKEEK